MIREPLNPAELEDLERDACEAAQDHYRVVPVRVDRLLRLVAEVRERRDTQTVEVKTTVQQ